jgi:uncharacterized phiE125 gp8 family phage protein
MSNILKTITKPTTLPTTLAEMKMHLRVTNTLENAYITALIGAARDWAETFTRRTFVKTTYKMSLDRFPNCPFYLPRSPLISIDSIKYLDEDNVEQTVAGTVYGSDDADSIPVRVFLKSEQSWPTDVLNQLSAVSVTFSTGYAADTAEDVLADVPKGIVAAINLLVGHWYENREEVVTGVTASTVPGTVERLLWSYRIFEDTVSP